MSGGTHVDTASTGAAWAVVTRTGVAATRTEATPMTRRPARRRIRIPREEVGAVRRHLTVLWNILHGGYEHAHGAMPRRQSPLRRSSSDSRSVSSEQRGLRPHPLIGMSAQSTAGIRKVAAPTLAAANCFRFDLRHTCLLCGWLSPYSSGRGSPIWVARPSPPDAVGEKRLKSSALR